MKFIIALLLLVIYSASTTGAEPDEAIAKGDWKITETHLQYRIGDDPQWAQLDIDKSQWQDFDRDKLIKYEGIYWVRLDFHIEANGEITIPSKVWYHTLAAFELYFDNYLLTRNGVVGATAEQEVPGFVRGHTYLPRNLIVSGNHVLALRISSHHWHKRDPLYRHGNLLIKRLNIVNDFEDFNGVFDRQFAVAFIAVNLFLALYYFILFIGNRSHRTHLLFSLLCISMFFLGMSENLLWIMNVPYNWDYFRFLVLVTSVTLTVSLLPVVFMRQFYTSNIKYWMLAFYSYYFACLYFVDLSYAGDWIVTGAFAGCLLIAIDALRRKQKYVWFSIVGILVCIVGYQIENNYFYFSFSILNLLMLAGITLQDKQNREQFHQSSLLASQFEAELLRKNIQPHFLMNSLTTILEWVEVEPDKAGQFIELLADEFRLFNHISQQALISMDEEVQICRLHLGVMGYRLQKEFILELDNVDLTKQIPPAIFHTLIENGISHNSYQQQQVTFVLKESVCNDGVEYSFLTPLADDNKNRQSYTSSGTGLKYIRSRLEQAFPKRWQLLSNQQDKYWLTQISIDRS